MAIRAILLGKQLRDKRKALEDLRAKDADFERREAELMAAIEEANADEEKKAVEDSVTEFERDKTAHDESKAALEREIDDLEADLKEEEAKQSPAPNNPPANGGTPTDTERKEDKIMNMAIRSRFFGKMTPEQRSALFERDNIKEYLGEIRAAIQEKRAITNLGLTIPEVFVGLLRENLTNYSKLYKRVTVRPVSGDARQLIMGTIPEGVWTDCCANLNELSLGFNDLEIGCWKVGGFFAICNANLEDSDLDLAAEILDAIAQAIGLALDKAILFGRNTSAHMKMPQGIVSRLAQTAAPSDYPATARPWANLSASNIKTIASTYTDKAFFQQLVLAAGAAKGKYARGNKVWVMNDTTYTNLVATALTINASGAIVTGINGTMPIIGGAIEVLDFIPDNVIIGGYFELYTLAERAGSKFATSEHVRFLQDQTVMKGTARYDGAPAIAEAFVAIGIGGVTPTAAMDFAPDTANATESSGN